MEILGIIAIVIIVLLVFSLMGWGLKILELVFGFFSEGCSTSWGCLIWIFAIIGLMAVL